MHMYIDTFGDRGDNTKAHEADPMSAEYDQRKLYVSLNSSSKAINFLWLLKKVIDKVQRCSYQLYPSPSFYFLVAHLVPLSGHKAESLCS